MWIIRNGVWSIDRFAYETGMLLLERIRQFNGLRSTTWLIDGCVWMFDCVCYCPYPIYIYIYIGLVTSFWTDVGCPLASIFVLLPALGQNSQIRGQRCDWWCPSNVHDCALLCPPRFGTLYVCVCVVIVVDTTVCVARRQPKAINQHTGICEKSSILHSITMDAFHALNFIFWTGHVRTDLVPYIKHRDSEWSSPRQGDKLPYEVSFATSTPDRSIRGLIR